jgi:hypothetical protein
MHAELARDAYDDPRVKLLMTLPGVDVAVAQTLIAAIGDVKRFRDGDHAASYLGIVPSTRQSADHCYHGPITKRGRSQARWMLVQAAQHMGSHPGPLGVFFRRLKKRKNHNIAVVATARKLMTIAWHMLKNNEPYRYAVPRTTETKLARLRVEVTGARKKGGNPKGTKRSATYGSGEGTRAVPAIDAVYAAEAIPPIKESAPGETRMLREAELTDFVAALHQPHRVQRKRRTARAPAATSESENGSGE